VTIASRSTRPEAASSIAVGQAVAAAPHPARHRHRPRAEKAGAARAALDGGYLHALVTHTAFAEHLLRQ
jgi:hypothetical protein